METLRVSTKQLTYRDCEAFFEGPVRVSLTKEASTNIERSHNRLLSILEKKRNHLRSKYRFWQFKSYCH